MNSITLIGRAGRDPEVRYFEDGKMVANLTLAVKRRSRDEEPDWFNLEIWGKQAQVAADYVRKGSLLGIIGSFKLDRWTDRSTGEERGKPVIRVDRLELLGSKRDGDDSSPAPAAAPARRQAPAGQPPAWDGRAPEEGDDIPF
jgi:single-strand DNA-binding protein